MKKLIAFLIAFPILFSGILYAQHNKVFIIDDFSKMLQSQVSPYLIPQGAAVEARNVRANDTYGALAKREDMRTYGSAGSYSIKSMHRYYKADGSQKLIVSGSTYLQVGDDDDGTFTVIRDQLTDALRWTWVTYKEKAIGCNGTDNCQKYDGSTTTTADTDGARTVNILTTDLGAPFAELNTGTNLDSAAWYQYKVAFYNGTTYRYSTARSNPILTGASVYNIYLTDIPLGPSGTTNRYIYRTLGGADRATVEADTTFYLVATIADNTTTVLADTVTDDTADDPAAPTWSTVSAGSDITPPVVKYITIHRDRLFGAYKSSYNSYFYWSNAAYHEIFDAADYDYVRIDDGDSITFIKELLGKLVIGKTNSITTLDTQNTDDNNWRLYTYSFIGCPAPYSVATSPLGIIYLNWDGLYVFNGQTSQLISDVVTYNIRDIRESNIAEAVGVFYDNEYQLAYTSESSGATSNDSILLLDVTRNAFVVDDKSINAFEIFDSGTDYGTLYSGSSGADGEVNSFTSNPSQFIVRYKSEFNAGTTDSVHVGGTEANPEVYLGWGITIDSTTMVSVTLDTITTYSLATIDVPSTTGSWISDSIKTNASVYEKLYWNESLGASGNITFTIRSGSSYDAAKTATWSSEFTDPSGDDLSGETTDAYMQLRAKFTTTDITETPTLDSQDNFSIKLVYSKIGTSSESSVESLWESGYYDFGFPTIPKRIWGIDIFYTSSSGTLTFNLENGEMDISKDFTIDLSINPGDDTEDTVFGSDTRKIFRWEPQVNSEEDTPIGRLWKFKITEPGNEEWKIYKIIVRYSDEEYY